MNTSDYKDVTVQLTFKDFTTLYSEAQKYEKLITWLSQRAKEGDYVGTREINDMLEIMGEDTYRKAQTL